MLQYHIPQHVAQHRSDNAQKQQVAFNLGNALGAYCGGLPLEMGLGYTYPALIGAPITFGGFLALYLFHRRYEQKNNR